MKKVVTLFLLIVAFGGVARAQAYTARADTLSAAMLKRLAKHSLSKTDSMLIKSARTMLRLKKTDTIGTDLLIKAVTGTLSTADLSLLKSEMVKIMPRDTLLINFGANGLSESNRKLDSIDLKMTECDFEKEANAMVLYDLGQMSSEANGVRVERHKRIKIFNEKGKSAANVKIDYTNQFGTERVDEIAGRTINFNNGHIEYTALDPALIYRQDTNKYRGSISFSMPAVKPGSVVEIRYVLHRATPRALPSWAFQTDIPTRYSQYVIQLFRDVNFMSLEQISQPLLKDSTVFGGYGHVWAMRDIPSLRTEPFMRSPADGTQGIEVTLVSMMRPDGQIIDAGRTWAAVGKQLASDKELNKTFYQGVSDKEGLVKHARALPNDSAKVSYLFNEVKTRMKWNKDKTWVSKDGIKKAWEEKSGNWGEINMVLCRLLNDAGVKAYPMLASTRDNGKMYSNFVDKFRINKLVAYVPVDSGRYYILDASGKYNTFNEVPFDLLNSNGLCIDKENDKYPLVLLKNSSPVKQEVMIDADIKSDGTMEGSAVINSFSYNKTNALQMHQLLDEKKYNELIANNDNSLQIRSIKLENAEVDSLPLTQNIDFKLDLPATDDKYIYFNPNLFTGLHDNPFISEDRFTDIDFGCNYLVLINGKYKIPEGYKVDVLPKTQTILMPDKSISFKRAVFQQDGYIIVNYVMKYKKSLFLRAEYAGVRDYFKRMSDLLNEQIVLKKG